MANQEGGDNIEHMLVHRLRRDLQDLRDRKKPKGQVNFDNRKAQLQPDWDYFRANGARIVGACQMASEIARGLEQMVDFDALMAKGGRSALTLEELVAKVEQIARDSSSEPSVNEQCRAALSLLTLMEELEWHFVN